MSTSMITSSGSYSYCVKNHSNSHVLILSSYSLPKNKHHPHVSSYPFNMICKFNAKHKVTMLMMGSSDNAKPESPDPAKPPSSGWKKWMVGLILSIILPSFRHKWGPLLVFKSKVDTAIETVESMTEIVEELAEEVEKVAEQVENKLPEDTKMKEAMESIETLAKAAVKEAQLAENLINKVQDVEKEMEAALLEAEKNKADVVSQQRSPAVRTNM